MGYWEIITKSGDDALWGDAPADCLDAGAARLVVRMCSELGRTPTPDEVLDAVPSAPEITEAAAQARAAFSADIGRSPTEDEMSYGMVFSSGGVREIIAGVGNQNA